MSKRVFLIVLDSVGAGAAPDAAAFGDAGADTIGSCARSGQLSVPTLASLGLYNIKGTSFYNPQSDLVGSYMKLTEKSGGKDTTVGHWEIAGTITANPLPTYPDGFPEEILKKLEIATGRKIICNKPYSGTQVIYDYGREQLETGALIVYTSADSVLQIAAHEDYIPIETLYDYCRKAREIMQGEHGVGRIIARPYVGQWPDFQRTTNRHDFSLQPPGQTMLDALMSAGLDTIGVGKIYDIFAGKSISRSTPNEGNDKNMEKTIALADEDFNGICFVNLVDFDMIYGHRRNIAAYTQALNAVDGQIAELMRHMRDDDILMITADHGCDPGYSGTDHTREYIPCLVYGKSLKTGVDLGTRECFADIAQTVTEYLDVDYKGDGESFLEKLVK